MKKQEVFAIVKKSPLKYREDLRCPLLSGQLPIFWNKRVAREYLEERGLVDECQIGKVVLRIP